MNDLKNKNIIITGASGGIGNSIVKKLDESGANILASGTKIEKLNELKSQFKNIEILKFDISETERIEEFIENAVKQLGGNLDCIVNNAGITQDNLGIRMDFKDWKKVSQLYVDWVAKTSLRKYFSQNFLVDDLSVWWITDICNKDNVIKKLYLYL